MTLRLLEPDSLPPPEASEPEEESPYLRRRKVVGVRRARRTRRFRLTALALGVLLPVGLAGYGLAIFAFNSNAFVLSSPQDVTVEGNRFVRPEEVLGALGLEFGNEHGGGANVFRLSLEALRHEVEGLPWVERAELTRILPHRLRVHITEREPVAFASISGQIFLVDRDGVILEKPEGASFEFPVVYGLENAGSSPARREPAAMGGRRARLRLFHDFMQELGDEAPRAGWTISEVYLADPEDLRSLLVSGKRTVQVHFGEGDFLGRFRNFLRLLPELERTDWKVDSVDLRYRNQIIVDPAPGNGGASPP